MQRTNSGCVVVDELLNGGFENEVITTIYGPAASGKTNICMISAIKTALDDKTVIYIDTEGGFSIERLKQLQKEPEKILDNILFFKPVSFEEQKKLFSKLQSLITQKTGLIIVDTIAMLYRLELGKSDEVYEVNKELGQQLAVLSQIARTKNIPVLVTNQVYSVFDDRDRVNMVGGDMLKYGSKCLVELQNYKNMRRAILRKHRSMPQKEVFFKIVSDGLEKVEE
ncbi:DNA repair and recombination protein RadB [Candidatus Woesearchaeota archaeon]|nr:DNA repair and recombination protein RadB [Candidatus Woesearchaeota archaeon]